MRRQSARRPRREGFTLLEVLLVLAILGVIAAIVVPRLLGQQREANIDAARASIEGFEKALELYALRNNGQFPKGDADEVVSLLMSNTDAAGNPQEPLLTEPPLDPWGNQLYYNIENTRTIDGSPEIWSSGPDGNDDGGSGDDISNLPQEAV